MEMVLSFLSHVYAVFFLKVTSPGEKVGWREAGVAQLLQGEMKQTVMFKASRLSAIAANEEVRLAFFFLCFFYRNFKVGADLTVVNK